MLANLFELHRSNTHIDLRQQHCCAQNNTEAWFSRIGLDHAGGGGCHLIVDAPKEVPFAVELVALVCVLRANTMLYTTCTGKRAAHCAAIGCIRMATTRAGSLPCRVSLGAASACTARGCGASHRAIPVDEVLPRLVTTELLRRAVRPQVLRVRAISIACRTSCDETTEVTGVLGV